MQYGPDRNTRWLDAGDVTLESGDVVPDVEVAYRTWGELNGAGDNAVLICHALTGDHNVDRWWGSAIGPDGIDPGEHFVVASNVLGGCYGTTGPTAKNPNSGRRWGPEFPHVTIRDLVAVQRLLLEALGVRKLTAVGGSMGGMQVLEWACSHPDLVRAIVPISVGAVHSPWCIGVSETQRHAIWMDPKWNGGWYDPDDPPAQGLATARQIGIVTYRSPTSFDRKFGRRDNGSIFEVESYLRYQGDELVRRFDANAYVTLTYAMDSHDVGRNRGGANAVLGALDLPTLVIGITSDVLYPVEEQHHLADMIPGARYEELDVPHGHDGFLIEHQAVGGLVGEFLAGNI